MAPRHPPQFVVRSVADAARERRRRLAWAVAGVLAVVLAAWGGFMAGRAGRAPAAVPAAAQPAVDVEALRQQVANLQRAAQVADIAARDLKRSLADRDEEISGLRTDLAFYSRLLGSNSPRDGLKVQGARVTRVGGSANAWNLVVTLTQNARRGDAVSGTVSVAVEGILGNKVTTLEGPALGQPADAKGLPFSFRYFQQVQGSFTLPLGFRPTRLRFNATAAGASATTAIAWADATRDDEVNHVQQQP
jgi:hypothetical protein